MCDIKNYNLLSANFNCTWQNININKTNFNLTSIINALENNEHPSTLFLTGNVNSRSEQLKNDAIYSMIHNFDNFKLWLHQTVLPSLQVMQKKDVKKCINKLRELHEEIYQVMNSSKNINHIRNTKKKYKCICTTCNKNVIISEKNCETYCILSQRRNHVTDIASCNALTHVDAERSNIAKESDWKVSSNGSTSGSDVSSTKNSKQKMNETVTNIHGSPKFCAYNEHVRNIIYPPQLIHQLRSFENNVSFNSIQKIEPRRYRCLLCKMDIMWNDNELKQHAIGHRHQHALSDSYAVSRVQNYHRISSSLPTEFQAHQVIFLPNNNALFVKCSVCHDRVQENNLLSHIFSTRHIQGLYTKKFRQYCLYGEMLASLGREVSEEDSSDKSSRKNKLLGANVKRTGNQVPYAEDIDAAEDTDEDLSEMSMKSQVIYNSAVPSLNSYLVSTSTEDRVRDIVQSDTIAQMSDKQPMSNSVSTNGASQTKTPVPHAHNAKESIKNTTSPHPFVGTPVKSENSKKTADTDKPPQQLEHNIILAQNPHAQDIFESLENRLQIHRSFIYYHNGGIVCKLCDIKFKFHITEIKRHICTSKHMKAAEKVLDGKLKHTYYCDLCTKFARAEHLWQSHLLCVEHKQRKDSLIQTNQSRDAMFIEYECTSCYHVIFGNKGSINKHLREPVTKSRKRKKEIKLPQQVDKLLKNEVKLNEEIQNLCKESEKVLESVELNWKCCEAIQIALEPEFGKCKAYPFGSRVSGLGTIESDLDVFVDTGFMYSGMLYQDADSQARFVTRTAKTLRRHPDFADLFSIPNARTPIVQVFHHPTRLDCDLSFRHGLSVENTEFLKLCINVQPSLKPLILILKKWSYMCKMNERITTYALSMLSIFYFQCTGYLPSLEKIRELDNTETKIIAGWKTFCYNKPITELQRQVLTCDKTTKELMCDFFGYYANFKYETEVVCPLLGHTVPKIDFHEDNASRLPPEMEVYVTKIHESDKNEVFRSMSAMCIQDPFDLSHNLTKACPESVVKKFSTLCEMSRAILSSK